MAIVKFGALISEARGKEAGLVFSRNSYGGYVKQKVSPINPQTTYQQTQRALLGGAAQSWAALGEDEKLQWKQFGQQMLRVNRFGDQTTFTGFNAYVKAYRNRTLLGLAPIDKPAAVATIPSLALVWAPQDIAIELGFTPTPLGAGFHLIIDATPPILSGRRFVKNFYRFVYATAANPTSAVDATAEYLAKFGTLPAVGNFVGVRVRVIHAASGWDGSYSVAGALTVAG
jgi:hypothetical protein